LLVGGVLASIGLALFGAARFRAPAVGLAIVGATFGGAPLIGLGLIAATAVSAASLLLRRGGDRQQQKHRE
jgi:hypothetical protein